MTTRLLSDAQWSSLLIEALQPYFDEGYVVYLMGTTWAFMERPVSARRAFLFGSAYLAARNVGDDQYRHVTVAADGTVSVVTSAKRP